MGSNNRLGGFKCSKAILVTLNVLYIIVGCVLIALAATGGASKLIADFSVMGGVIACGVFLLIIAIVGLVGTILHHQVTLFFYMSILFLLFVVQFAIACACLALTKQQQQDAIQWTWNHSSPEERIIVQKVFGCCGGAGNNESVLEHDGIFQCNNTTSGCCEKNPQASCCTGNWSIDSNDTCPCEACWQRLEGLVEESIRAVGAVGLVFSLTELIGVWLTFRFRNQKDPYADPSQFL